MDSNRTYRVCLCQDSWHRDSCSGRSTLKEPSGLACDAHGMKSRVVYKRVSEERFSLADTAFFSNQPATCYYFVLLLSGTSYFACSQQLATLALVCSQFITEDHCLNYLCKRFCRPLLYNHGIVLPTHARPKPWFGKSARGPCWVFRRDSRSRLWCCPPSSWRDSEHCRLLGPSCQWQGCQRSHPAFTVQY